MADSEYDSWSGTIVAKTAKAVLLDMGDGERWVPLSVLSEESREEIEKLKRDDNVDAEIAEWWADKNLR